MGDHAETALQSFDTEAMGGIVKAIIGGGGDDTKEEMKKQKLRLEQQRKAAEAEKAEQVRQQSSKVKTMTGSGYGQRSLLSPTRTTLG